MNKHVELIKSIRSLSAELEIMRNNEINNVLNEDISILGITTRAYTLLKKNNFNTVAEVQKLIDTNQLGNIRNMSPKAYSSIMTKMDKLMKDIGYYDTGRFEDNLNAWREENYKNKEEGEI